MANRPTMLALVWEHNRLNGFWFVLVEFLLIALFTLGLGAAELLHGRYFWAVAYSGIGVNAAAICATVIGQMHRGERSSSLRATLSGPGREKMRREHPDLDRHTLAIVAATLIPFLLAGLVLRNK